MYAKYIKRIIDFILACIGVPFFVIAFIVFAPLIYNEDKGPVFYNALRLGRNGETFKMFKFRSMKVNAPDYRNEDGSTFNSDEDVRVTKIGSILRKSSIDELPQLLNVLIGDMSFIGPRPDLTEDIKKYNDYQMTKLTIRPGITGYSQAYFRNSVPQEKKFNNDAYYAENLTFLFDIKILIKTIITVAKKENVYKNEGNCGN